MRKPTGRPPTPLADRFWPKVDREPGCWVWTGTRTRNGYGKIRAGGPDLRMLLAHRVAYELVVGSIPAGLTLDHLCRVRLCVNPEHLEPVTIGENVLRGDTLSARNAAKTHCKHGHEFTPENTRMEGRMRRCRCCSRLNSAALRERRRAA